MAKKAKRTPDVMLTGTWGAWDYCAKCRAPLLEDADYCLADIGGTRVNLCVPCGRALVQQIQNEASQ